MVLPVAVAVAVLFGTPAGAVPRSGPNVVILSPLGCRNVECRLTRVLLPSIGHHTIALACSTAAGRSHCCVLVCVSARGPRGSARVRVRNRAFSSLRSGEASHVKLRTRKTNVPPQLMLCVPTTTLSLCLFFFHAVLLLPGRRRGQHAFGSRVSIHEHHERGDAGRVFHSR